MKIFSAENDNFSLLVKETGAELHSLKSKKSGKEFIWQGNPDIWYGQSPILFPIVGRLLDDKYRLNGVEYTMTKHGVVRKKPFELAGRTDDSITLKISDDEETLKMYPYHFELLVNYQLTEKGLKVTHTVINKNDTVMYFCFGAHPGFNCNIGDTLEFEHPQIIDTERIDITRDVLSDETYPLLNNEKAITVTEDIFENDALILKGYTDDAITLNSSDRKIKFYITSPLLGIWAKPGAPYVCLEPWWGIDDDGHKKADLSQKREIMSLEPGFSRDFSWEVEISE